MQALKELPEEGVKEVRRWLIFGIIAVTILLVVGVEVARGPTPEMIIAPDSSYSTTVPQV